MKPSWANSIMGIALKIEDIGINIKRVMKNKGSFYIFGDDAHIAYIQVRLDKHFTFLNTLVWYKRNNLPVKFAHNHRRYCPMSERILFYSLQDQTGLERVKLDVDNFKSLRKYFYELLCWMGETNKSVAKRLGHRKAEHSFYVLPKKKVIDEIRQSADHCFRYGSTQWDLPTEETYNELIKTYNIDKWQGYQEYEELRHQYEELRRPFNFKNGIYEVIDIPIITEKENTEHPTTKPLELIKNFVEISSNENDLVLDPFLGSGTTAVACEKLNRRWIGIEISKEYCDIAVKRIDAIKNQARLYEFGTLDKMAYTTLETDGAK